MRTLKLLVLAAFTWCVLAGPGIADEKKPKLTCCQEAKAKGEECKHRCCINAHKANKSCEKCNPHKEDLKKDPKSGRK